MQLIYNPDTVVLQCSVCNSIEAMMILNQLHWAGYVRIKDNRFLKQIFYGELKAGKCP